MKITIKRVYEESEKSDGMRILVDRIWPRGLSKEKAAVDFWFKEIAPSTELRKWFQHDPDKWTEFKKKYRAELSKNKEALSLWKEHRSRGNHTLLYAAKDELHNQAVVLQDWLSKK